MEEIILLSELTTDGVSVVTRKCITLEGEKHYVGDPHRKAYVNSESGRAEISAELSEPYLSAVMTVWGTSPSIIEPDGN